MPHSFAQSERLEMALWCFPIVSDLTLERYGAAIGRRHASLRIVSFQHSQLWQALILDDAAAKRKGREVLGASHHLLGLSPDFMEDLDEEVLDELMEVVTQRFYRSPLKASACGHILLHIAKNLAYTPRALTAA
jgi:hypothetical protein